MFEISTDPDSGGKIAVDATRQCRVLMLPDGESRMFKRRAVKTFPDGHQEEVTWLVAELDGVRVYVESGDIVVTRREIYP